MSPAGRPSIFIVPPFCPSCGAPFAYDPGADAVCAACAIASPGYDRARAVLRYGETARRLVAGLKYADRLHLTPTLSEWLWRCGAELLADAELLVPVPLHRRRLIARRFNQSALLALGVSRRSGVPAAPDMLVRHRATPAQAGLSRSRRARNVRGAFHVPPALRAGLAERRILLVDDVVTTGATAAACARVLRRAGAARIDVLSLARVVRSN